jgi:hypothetical protein
MTRRPESLSPLADPSVKKATSARPSQTTSAGSPRGFRVLLSRTI